MALVRTHRKRRIEASGTHKKHTQINYGAQHQRRLKTTTYNFGRTTAEPHFVAEQWKLHAVEGWTQEHGQKNLQENTNNDPKNDGE